MRLIIWLVLLFYSTHFLSSLSDMLLSSFSIAHPPLPPSLSLRLSVSVYRYVLNGVHVAPHALPLHLLEFWVTHSWGEIWNTGCVPALFFFFFTHSPWLPFIIFPLKPSKDLFRYFCQHEGSYSRGHLGGSDRINFTRLDWTSWEEFSRRTEIPC